MGISMVYVAPQTVPAGCSAPPTDMVNIQPAQLAHIPYRKKTPRFVVPLTTLDPNGSGRAISVKRRPARP